MRKKHNWWRFWKYWSFELREESRDAEGSVKSASREENFKELIPFCILQPPAENIAFGGKSSKKITELPPRILSNYIHAIYGMLYDIYFRYFWIRKFFQKNAPYNVCYCSFIEECPLITSLIENWETREMLWQNSIWGKYFWWICGYVVVNSQD